MEHVGCEETFKVNVTRKTEQTSLSVEVNIS